MSERSIRPAFGGWRDIDRRLREAIAPLTTDQLALSAGPDRWPLRAVFGHLCLARRRGERDPDRRRVADRRSQDLKPSTGPGLRGLV